MERNYSKYNPLASITVMILKLISKDAIYCSIWSDTGAGVFVVITKNQVKSGKPRINIIILSMELTPEPIGAEDYSLNAEQYPTIFIISYF